MLLQVAGDANLAVPKDRPSRNGPGIMAAEIARAPGVSGANVSMLVAQRLRMGLFRQEERPADLCSAMTRLRPRGRQQIFVTQVTRQPPGAHRNVFADPLAG